MTVPETRGGSTRRNFPDGFRQPLSRRGAGALRHGGRLLDGPDTQAGAAKFAETFKDFPPVQKPNTFTVDDALAKMRETMGGAS